MESITHNTLTSLGQSRATGTVARSERGHTDFRLLLAKTESTALALDVAEPSFRNPLPAASFHTVRSGETLYGISRKVLESRGLEATPAAIMRAVIRLGEYNGITDRNRIYPNQRINTTVLNGSPGKAVENVNSPGPRTDNFNPFVGSGGTSHASVPSAPSAPSAQINAEPDTHFSQRGALTTSEFLAYSNAAMCHEVPANDFCATTQNRENVTTAIAPTNLPQLPVIPDGAQEVNFLRPIAFTGSGGPLSNATAEPPSAGSALPNIFYMGAIGKALDYVPMETETRVVLQQAGSVVSGALSGLKLAGLLGVATPIAAAVGLVWGIFSATNIKPAQGESPQK
jgi:hypothetical protein